MKRLLTFMLTTALLLSFNSYSQETAKKSKKAKMQKMHAGGMAMTGLPYTAFYSSHFAMGNPEHAKMVLTLYKDFENNDWSKDSWFADTVTVYNPDGTIFRGKQQVLEGFKKFRESISSTQFMMAAIIPLRSVDQDEDWVGLWGTQEMKSAQNSVSTTNQFQAIWKIDKNNKVAEVRFYEAVMSEQQ